MLTSLVDVAAHLELPQSLRKTTFLSWARYCSRGFEGTGKKGISKLYLLHECNQENQVEIKLPWTHTSYWNTGHWELPTCSCVLQWFLDTCLTSLTTHKCVPLPQTPPGPAALCCTRLPERDSWCQTCHWRKSSQTWSARSPPAALALEQCADLWRGRHWKAEYC